MSDSYTIGKYYAVPCIKNPPWPSAGRWLPIIGPLHEDAEIVKFEYLHWHIDWRFVSGRFLSSTDSVSRRSVLARVLVLDVFHEVIIRKMKCKRAMPEFPNASWLVELEPLFARCRLSRDLVCPHRGIPLAGCPVKDGLVVCPGHGLRWNVTTGELKRTTGV